MLSNNNIGEVINGIWECMSSFPVSSAIQLLTLVLVSLSAYLGIQTHTFQIRTSIRESIEQLDKLEIGTDRIFKPLLHDFEYSPFGSMVVVHIRQQSIGTDASSARYTVNSFHWLTEDEVKTLCRAMENLEGVTKAEVREFGIDITCKSNSPVEVRNATEAAMHVIRVSSRQFGNSNRKYPSQRGDDER